MLPWALAKPSIRRGGAGSKIVFPAATLGRKGAYELPTAAHALQLRLTLMGPVLECADFWDGVEVEQLARADEHWLDGVAVVVLPACL